VSATDGASIGYQLLADGEAPGPTWQVYTEEILVPAGHRLVAVAHRIGYVPSEITEVRGPGLGQ
jgi:hypothetical protein